MNEDLLNDLGDAMKRRDKAAAAIARWQEQKEDAEEDIKELSARITQAAGEDPEAPTYGNPEPEAEVLYAGFKNENWTTIETAPVPE